MDLGPWGGLFVDRKPDSLIGPFSSSDDVSSLSLRNRFEKAVQLSWSGPFLPSLDYGLRASLSYTHSFIQNDIWLNASVRGSLNSGVEVFALCDFFGGPGEILVSQDFISTYQNNDRCLLGTHYVF